MTKQEILDKIDTLVYDCSEYNALSDTSVEVGWDVCDKNNWDSMTKRLEEIKSFVKSLDQDPPGLHMEVVGGSMTLMPLYTMFAGKMRWVWMLDAIHDGNTEVFSRNQKVGEYALPDSEEIEGLYSVHDEE